MTEDSGLFSHGTQDGHGSQALRPQSSSEPERHRDERGPTEVPEDLCALARRGSLSEVERRRFEVCLLASPTLRLLYDLGRDFDRVPESLPADRELLAAITAQVAGQSAVMAAHGGGLLHRVQRLMAKLRCSVVAPVAIAGVVGLYVGGSALHAARSRARGRDGAPVAAVLAARPPLLLPALPAGGGDAAAAAAAPESEAAIGRPEVATVRKAPRAQPGKERPHLAASGLGAAALFSLANEARSGPDPARSVSLYTQLQSEYPRSSEAASSLEILGRWFLDHGSPGPARAQFDRYLRRNPSGSLAEEALHGKAQALEQLGRRREAKDVWIMLLKRFPNSVYSTTARERLGFSRASSAPAG